MKKKKLLIILLVCLALLPPLVYGLIQMGTSIMANNKASAPEQVNEALTGLFLAVAIQNNYSYMEQREDGFDYLIRERDHKVGVCGYTYDPESGDTVVTIPDSHEGYPIKSLGGYVGKGGPCPFNIDVKGLRTRGEVAMSEGSFDWYLRTNDHLEVVILDLTLNIGPNVEEIYVDQSGILAVGELYVVRVYINCDPANRKFYSEDGILYHKNGEAVEGFLYWNQNYVGTDK